MQAAISGALSTHQSQQLTAEIDHRKARMLQQNKRARLKRMRSTAAAAVTVAAEGGRLPHVRLRRLRLCSSFWVQRLRQLRLRRGLVDWRLRRVQWRLRDPMAMGPGPGLVGRRASYPLVADRRNFFKVEYGR